MTAPPRSESAGGEPAAAVADTAAVSSPGGGDRPRRRPELDLLRITACLIQFPFHTGMVFSHDPLYHIKNPVMLGAFDVITIFLHIWRMPLFFFIAGALTRMRNNWSSMLWTGFPKVNLAGWKTTSSSARSAASHTSRAKPIWSISALRRLRSSAE